MEKVLTGGAVNGRKSLPKGRRSGDGNTASGHVFCPVWVTVWVTPVSGNGDVPKVAEGERKAPLSGWKAVLLWLRGWT